MCDTETTVLGKDVAESCKRRKEKKVMFWWRNAKESWHDRDFR